jgi:hypothetical protein
MEAELTELEQKIMTELAHHVGKAYALDRWDLVLLMFGYEEVDPRNDSNRADRAVRKAIESLRSQGRIICNLGDGAGWFLPATDEEYRAFRAVYGSHAFPIMENLQAMDHAAQEQWPNALQPRLLP